VDGSIIDETYDMNSGMYDDFMKYEIHEHATYNKDVYPEYSRHYETESLAIQSPDGSWIGWTHWYGGGKHGNPEEIEWIDSVYNLDCKEESKWVIVQTFKKVE
jgi:hypothetical protein